MWVWPAGHQALQSGAGDGAAVRPAMHKALRVQQNPHRIRPLLSECLVTALRPHLALFKAEQQPQREGVNPAHGQTLQTLLLLGRRGPAALPQSWGWRKSRCRCREAIMGDAWGPGAELPAAGLRQEAITAAN